MELCISCKTTGAPGFLSLSLTFCSVPLSLPCSCICTSDPGGLEQLQTQMFSEDPASLVLLDIMGAWIYTHPGTSFPPSTGGGVGRAHHICFQSVPPLSRKGTVPAAKAQGRRIPHHSVHHFPIFSLASIQQLPGLWNLSTDTTAQSANLHKSVAFPRAPCSGRVMLSPQTQGLLVLSQTRAHTNLLQQLQLI